jgi:hypothetical protein
MAAKIKKGPALASEAPRRKHETPAGSEPEDGRNEANEVPRSITNINNFPHLSQAKT